MGVEPQTRRFFAEEIRAAAALPDGSETERVLDAFAAVPREDHAGPGPWLLLSAHYGLASRRTPDDDPAQLYHNVLIVLDEAQGINIGEPSLWARLLSRTAVAEGSSILQVGAGSGYYSAILAKLAGQGGYVLAMEAEGALADMAERALNGRANVEVRHGNGATELTADDGPFDLIVAFAGVTHPTRGWTNRLKPDGRLLVPLTGENWWGAMILAQRVGDEFQAHTLGRCGFFPCAGARDLQAAKRIDGLWSVPSRMRDKTLRIRFEDGTARYHIEGQIY